jgi:hypothetical protein
MIEIKKSLILEKSEQTHLIRQIVRDIIKIYKTNDDGEFYLPEDLGGEEMEYRSAKNSVSVELTLEMSDDVDDFMSTAFFVRNENVIEIKIVYNPKNKTKITYDLIGELNEILAHELRHLYQRDTGLFDFGDEDDEEEEELPPFEYYSQPEEIDAQVYGFRRMKKVTRRPFEELVRNWFRTHKEIHHLNEKEQEKIIKMILDYNSKI